MVSFLFCMFHYLGLEKKKIKKSKKAGHLRCTHTHTRVHTHTHTDTHAAAHTEAPHLERGPAHATGQAGHRLFSSKHYPYFTFLIADPDCATLPIGGAFT